jgi:uncharacterized protein YciI
MSEPDPAGWVTITHPETGGTAEVHRDSLHQHYASGWRLLADDEVRGPEPEPEPAPVSKAQAARDAKAAEAAQQAAGAETASAETEEN